MAWQSRSGSPSMPWLEPELNDCLRELAADDVRAVTIIPIGFVSDHMEVMFDLDREVAATAAEVGLEMTRAATPATTPDPEFVAMFRELIEERLEPDRPRRGVGTLGIRPDACPAGCCSPA